METSEIRVETGAMLYVADPDGPGEGEPCLLICPGLPVCQSEATAARRNYRDLAERLCQDAGWAVATLDTDAFCGPDGEFSVSAWIANLEAAVAKLLLARSSVWLAGFGEGATVALCVGGSDPRIAGVVALGAPADFSSWTADPDAIIRRAVELGLLRGQGAAVDMAAWVRDLQELRPLEAVTKLPPRPVLLLHGSEDEQVSSLDARAYLDAMEGHAQLRILPGADHALRHDPRAVAILGGWMDRQRP